MSQRQICIVGSGNWGSVVSKIIGQNVKAHPKEFNQIVKMWVYEEIIQNRKLTEIINNDHENVKYLPGIKLPENVLAVPDLVEASQGCEIFIFVVPHQFIDDCCKKLVGKIPKNSIGISLIKGVETGKTGLTLISQAIKNYLDIDVSVLMGANIANEIAQENFCESTIGYHNLDNALVFKKMFHTKYFRISLADDVAGVELCGALKNVVALAAGFVDGLKMGENTKAAVIRIGLMEMIKFCQLFYPGTKMETFFESCGIADVITTCFGGRNRKVAEACVLTGKKIDELEKEMLNGQMLQGPLTAKEIHQGLVGKSLVKEFPLFNAVYRVCYEQVDPKNFFDLF